MSTEAALVQAAHNPAQREMICRRLVVQLLQQNGGGDKRFRVRARCQLQHSLRISRSDGDGLEKTHAPAGNATGRLLS